MIDAQIAQKNIKKVIASAGHADPGQGGIWEDNARQAEVQHAVAHPPDGRADLESLLGLSPAGDAFPSRREWSPFHPYSQVYTFLTRRR